MLTRLRAPLLALAAMLCAAAPARADDRVAAYESGSGFEDTAFAVENAILNHGLVIDYESHVGDMLARTGADVGSDVQVFEDAKIYVFCSAVLSRKMMEADRGNIGFCPWGVYVYAAPGETARSVVGYRKLVAADTPEDSPLREIEALLDAIAKEGAGLE